MENAAELTRLREQIKADREERLARESRGKAVGKKIILEDELLLESPTEDPKDAEEEKKPQSPVVHSDAARINARFPDGSTLELSFASYENFQVVHDAVSRVCSRFRE